MAKAKKIVLKAVGVAGALVLRAPLVLAQDVPIPGGNPSGNSAFDSVQDTIDTIFKIVIAAAGAIFVVLLLVGGIQYLTAAGNEETTAKARRLLVDSIVGLFIVLAAWAIGNFVLSTLNVI